MVVFVFQCAIVFCFHLRNLCVQVINLRLKFSLLLCELALQPLVLHLALSDLDRLLGHASVDGLSVVDDRLDLFPRLSLALFELIELPLDVLGLFSSFSCLCTGSCELKFQILRLQFVDVVIIWISSPPVLNTQGSTI